MANSLFINDEITNSFVFNPCDSESLVNHLLNFKVNSNIERSDFIEKFKRSRINENMVTSILNYL